MTTALEDSVVIAKFDYEATEPNEISFRKGDRFFLLDGSRHWWLVQKLEADDTGYVPSNFMKQEKKGIMSRILLKKQKKSPASTVSMPNHLPPIGVALVKHSYEAKNPDELTLLKGTKVQVLQKKDDGWWLVEACSHKGWYPSNYLSEKLQEFGSDCGATQLSVADWKNIMLSIQSENQMRSLYSNDPISRTTSEGQKSLSRLFVHDSFRQKTPLSTSWSAGKAGGESFGLASCGTIYFDDCLGSIKRCRSVQFVRPLKPAMSQRNETLKSPINAIKSKPSVLSICKYKARSEKELNVARGERLIILCDDNVWTGTNLAPGDWVCVQNSFGQTGAVPADILMLVENNTLPAHLRLSDSTQDNSKKEQGKYRRSDGSTVMSESSSVAKTDDSFLPFVELLQTKPWPSDLTPPSSLSSLEEDMVEQGHSLRGYDWYFGMISREDAERLLDTFGEEGDFLVRDSFRSVGLGYSISMKTSDRNRHFKVDVFNGLYQIGRRTFPSMNELILYYQSHPIFDGRHSEQYQKSNQPKLCLVRALRTNPYSMQLKCKF